MSTESARRAQKTFSPTTDQSGGLAQLLSSEKKKSKSTALANDQTRNMKRKEPLQAQQSYDANRAKAAENTSLPPVRKSFNIPNCTTYVRRKPSTMHAAACFSKSCSRPAKEGFLTSKRTRGTGGRQRVAHSLHCHPDSDDICPDVKS